MKERRLREKQLSEFVILLHHKFCREYGWIPVEEFKKIPIVTAFNLLGKLNEEYEQYEKEMEKIKSKARVR